MISAYSDKWISFVKHILKEEGGTSKNPNDTASSCVDKGKIHTNKGVTFCTFKDKAAKLKIEPVTYERFLNLTDEEAALFIYSYYNTVKGNLFPDSVALVLTNIAWLSGPARASQLLFKGLAELGQTAKSFDDAAIIINKFNDEKIIFDEITKQYQTYLKTLLKNPKYSTFTGWLPRLKRFYEEFLPEKKKLILPLAILFTIFLIYKLKK